MISKDAEIIQKAIELQRLATCDYNNIFNTLTGTSASETVLSVLSEELKIAEDVKQMLNSMYDCNENKTADSQTVRRTINEIKS